MSSTWKTYFQGKKWSETDCRAITTCTHWTTTGCHCSTSKTHWQSKKISIVSYYWTAMEFPLMKISWKIGMIKWSNRMVEQPLSSCWDSCMLMTKWTTKGMKNQAINISENYFYVGKIWFIWGNGWYLWTKYWLNSKWPSLLWITHRLVTKLLTKQDNTRRLSNRCKMKLHLMNLTVWRPMKLGWGK